MKMYKALLLSVSLGSLLFVGCAEKKLSKDKVSKNDDNYTIVINKSIKDCAEHNIILDEKRTNDFMRKSPKKTIDKAAAKKEKTAKELCQFFAEETSLEKVKKADEFVEIIVKSCDKVGVILPREGIEKQVKSLPFFVIRKGLSMQKDSSLEECRLMEEKYK